MKKAILIARIYITCPVLSMIGVAGDVTFGPDMLKTTLGGREEYFIMGQ